VAADQKACFVELPGRPSGIGIPLEVSSSCMAIDGQVLGYFLVKPITFHSWICRVLPMPKKDNICQQTMVSLAVFSVRF